MKWLSIVLSWGKVRQRGSAGKVAHFVTLLAAVQPSNKFGIVPLMTITFENYVCLKVWLYEGSAKKEIITFELLIRSGAHKPNRELFPG